MIFGFNTDVKQDETVYHVQSEARESEKVFETQVFVRGRCIGKRSSSYGEMVAKPGFTDQEKEQMLREQHRMLLDAIRDRRLDQVFDKRESPEALAAIRQLDIQWLNADSIHDEDKLSMKLRATEGGRPLAGARLTVRLTSGNAAPSYSQVDTDEGGVAELAFIVDEASLSASSILVQVNSQGRTATRKFQPQRAES
ncbi:MAG: hypothetical protein JO159_06160 [Acidobacteria bacterium]|nr:hypothetical protein [Acidobacteriota bacterium]MBV9623936.1 hypothetical protein [Acidobacteriota bacterium]